MGEVNRPPIIAIAEHRGDGKAAHRPQGRK
jgi:hypothetical protein